MNGTKNFDRQTLEQALAELGRRALAAERIVEIVLQEIFSTLHPGSADDDSSQP